MNQIIDATRIFLVESGKKKTEEMREKRRLATMWFLAASLMIGIRLGLYIALIEGRQLYSFDSGYALFTGVCLVLGLYWLKRAQQIKADPDVQKFLRLQRLKEDEDHEAEYG